MAPQAHETDRLVKAVLEGFAIVDKIYGRNKMSGKVPTTQAYHDHLQMHQQQHHYYNHNNQQPYVYRGPQVITVTEPVMNSNQAAQFYEGMTVVDYSMRKPIARAY